MKWYKDIHGRQIRFTEFSSKDGLSEANPSSLCFVGCATLHSTLFRKGGDICGVGKKTID
jgi:hypothetical protein